MNNYVAFFYKGAGEVSFSAEGVARRLELPAASLNDALEKIKNCSDGSSAVLVFEVK